VLDYQIILLIVAGFGSGVIVGVGSGTAGGIMIPVLSVFIGCSVYNAIGTSLFIDCVIGGIAGFIFLKKGNVEMRAALFLAISGVLGAFIGSRFTQATPESGLSIFIGILLILLGMNFIIKGIRKNAEYIKSKISFKFINENKTFSLIIFGLFIGFISGFSGIGGGGIVALILIFVLWYDVHTAIGTSLLMTFFIAGSGTIGHLINREIVPFAALIAGFMAGGGAASGALFANRIDEDKLGRIVGVIILILGISTIIKILT
jgi:hypothetical protein